MAGAARAAPDDGFADAALRRFEALTAPAPAEPHFAAGPADLASPALRLSMSGLAFMQELLEGRQTWPAMWRTAGSRLVAVAPGEVVFRGMPHFAHTNPMGNVHGGWFGTTLDSALGCAVMTCLPPGAWYTTLEYKVNLIRALKPGEAVEVRARVLHCGRSTGVAEASMIRRSDGRVVASGSTTCMVFQGAAD